MSEAPAVRFFHAPSSVAFGSLRPATFLRFDSSAAARASSRLRAAGMLGAPCVLTGAELVAWLLSLAMDTTALRFIDKSIRLPVFVTDRAAQRAAEAEGAIVSPLSGNGAVIGLDPMGPVYGRTDERACASILAARGLFATLSTTKTKAPPTGIPIEGGGSSGLGGEQLGVAPAVVGIIAAGVVVGIGVVSYFTADTVQTNHMVDSVTTAKMLSMQLSHQETLTRWATKVSTGVELAPSPLEGATAKMVEDLGKDGKAAGWKFFGFGAGLGVAGIIGGRYVADRMGAR